MNLHGLRRLGVSLSLVAASTALTILAVLAADRVLGRMLEDPRLTAGLIFPPQVELAVKTYEYAYTIKTNALGLRDEPYDPRNRPQVLVAAIGDSFTFGQGVELEDTWVQRVERTLRDKGLDVEILNFGQPGSAPPQYASLAEEALPLVAPDLVLVDVLQSNDLFQIDPTQPLDVETHRRDPKIRTLLRAWVPSLTDLAYRQRAQLLAGRERESHGRWNLLQTRWQQDVQRYLNDFDTSHEGARLTFMSLPAPIQQAFRNGELQPGIVQLCAETLRMNRQAWWDLEVNSPEIQSRIEILARCLGRVDRAAKLWGGRTVVLSLPLMDNNDPFARKLWYRLFGALERPGLDDTRTDDAIHQAARRANLPSHDVTAAFRAAAGIEPLFYPLDTHLNARGNEVYADLITPILERYVREVAQREPGFPPNAAL